MCYFLKRTTVSQIFRLSVAMGRRRLSHLPRYLAIEKFVPSLPPAPGLVLVVWLSARAGQNAPLARGLHSSANVGYLISGPIMIFDWSRRLESQHAMYVGTSI